MCSWQGAGRRVQLQSRLGCWLATRLTAASLLETPVTTSWGHGRWAALPWGQAGVCPLSQALKPVPA